MLAAEDARGDPAERRALLIRCTHAAEGDLQRLAVRALGRLEQPDLLPHLLPLLSARAPVVRAEAANAIAQTPSGQRDVSAGTDTNTLVSEPLLARFAIEQDHGVRAVIAEALGRVAYRTPESIRQVEAALVSAAGTAGSPKSADPIVALGATKGLAALIRLHGRTMGAPAPATIERLRQLATVPVAANRVPPPAGKTAPVLDGFATDASARVRRLALAALIDATAADLRTITTTIADADAQVRRLAVVAAGRLDDGAGIIERSARDPSFLVRIEAVRAAAAQKPVAMCRVLQEALEDPSLHVVLQAIDGLGACPAAIAAETLERLAEPPPASRAGSDSSPEARPWHPAAHALLSLATVAPAGASRLLQRFTAHPVWQLRMYAARAATVLNDGTALDTLARDDHDNVREAAIEGLSRTRGHEADRVYLQAIGRDDYQVIRTAALALKGTKGVDPVTVDTLVAALARLTTARRDTSRDPRMALLDRIAELGSAAQTGALRPYLQDFDPRVAARTAEVLSAWTNQPHKSAPVPLMAPPLPDARELDRLSGARVRVTMKGRTSFELRLLPEDAPVTAARFVRLATAGYYNGLTFHRVVPNFVIQGGSPGANEYMGDGPYLRDELGLRPHVRGAVGISTRGRDTGDAQIFIDLVDNPRLDHDYTVFAEVQSGMEVVDGIVEGDVIEKIELVAARF